MTSRPRTRGVPTAYPPSRPPAGRQPAHRRRRRGAGPLTAVLAIVVGSVIGVIGIAGAAGGIQWDDAAGSDQSGTGQSVTSPPPASPPPATGRPGKARATPTQQPVTYPDKGQRLWQVAAGRSKTYGTGGPQLSFRVAVERGISGVHPAEFADAVVNALGDPRSWTAAGRWRLRRVAPNDPADFTVYLATPTTRDLLCGGGRDRYTSCRNGDKVVINVARWVHGVPHFGAPLAIYQQYVINHEVGHRLGHGHELCPGPGRAAPVMQQQTLGMHGCVANAWPVVGGKSYHGQSGAYDDPIPNSG